MGFERGPEKLVESVGKFIYGSLNSLRVRDELHVQRRPQVDNSVTVVGDTHVYSPESVVKVVIPSENRPEDALFYQPVRMLVTHSSRF
jgi:hypothetical protein